MDQMRVNMPMCMHTTLNGHIHSLLYAAWVFLFELSQEWQSSRIDHRSIVKSLLQRNIDLLEELSTFRPAASQALINLKSAIKESEASENPAHRMQPTGTVDTAPDSSETSNAWPADGLDAFLFSSTQWSDTGNQSIDASADTWLSTAALFQSQGDWSTFR